MTIFRHFAEVCPRCGAVGTMRKDVPDPNRKGKWLYRGKSMALGGEQRTYVACANCLARALRVTMMPPK